MNEVSNFCDGTCYADEEAKLPVKHTLPYTPTGRDLESRGLSLDAKHANGDIELDVHSLYGTLQAKATREWFMA